MTEQGRRAPNVHATAIVAGTTGIMFVGSSGCGKSELAFAVLTAAQRAGLFAAIVADDQVFLETVNGHVLARRPASIANLMEFRGTGIGHVKSLPQALMHVVVRPVNPAENDRLPPEDERFAVDGGISLPLVRLPVTVADPFAILSVFYPELPR